MHKINLLNFYRVGQGINRLTYIPEGESSINAWMKLSRLEHWVQVFLEETREVSIPATRQAALNLSKHLAHLTAEQLELASAKKDEPITLHASALLEQFIKHFESEFEHECRELNVFSISDVGTHSTTKLLESAHGNLPSEVVSRLSKEVISDVDQAGRCIAFSQSTASAFHILRAVEKVIMTYLEKVLGKPINPKSRNWGAYIRELKALGADIKVADYLYHLKEYYRNPIMHPEVVLSQDEAFSLFDACLSAIVQLEAAIESWP